MVTAMFIAVTFYLALNDSFILQSRLAISEKWNVPKTENFRKWNVPKREIPESGTSPNRNFQKVERPHSVNVRNMLLKLLTL